MSAFQLIQTDAATAVSSRAPTKPVVLGSIDKTLNTPFAVVVQALPHKVYRLVEAQTQQPVKGQRLVRKGNNLLVEVDGAVMANLTGFFSNDAAPGSAQPGATPQKPSSPLALEHHPARSMCSMPNWLMAVMA